ncbi:MAG: RNA polymerase sigma factor [Cypionkella sp.]
MIGVDPRDELVTHLPALRAFALSLARNGHTADDLVQETVLRAWANFESFVPGTNLRAWLFTILRNGFYSDLRKHRREVQDSDGVHAGNLSQKPDHDGRLAMRDFQRGFENLIDEQREALALVGALGFSYEEAAQTIGCAVGTVKSRVNRGRVRLAEYFHLEDGDSILPADAIQSAAASARNSLHG